MISAFYVAASGAGAFQNGLNVGADNLANVNTVGHKARRAEFSDLMYTRLPAQTQGAQAGSGAGLAGVSRLPAQGALEDTGSELDAAVGGEGYFCVRNSAGETFYTRAGNFKLEPAENGSLLTTQSGEYVLDQDMNPVRIGPEQELKLLGPSAEGSGGDMPSGGAVRLAVVRFANPGALTGAGGGLFSANAASGAGELMPGAEVLQGMLERSNVDITEQMRGLIASQRGFQLSARMITTADELEQTANSLR